MSSCTLDDPGSSDPSPALTLHALQDYSLTTLSWTPVHVTGFKEYILLQSSSEIPNSSTPVVNGNVTIVKRIDNADITSIVNSDILLSPTTCYKLYADIGDRFLYSSNICIESANTLISGFYDRIAHEPGEQEIVMFDRNINRISTYILGENEVELSIPEGFFSNPALHQSTYNGKREAFLSDRGFTQIKRYNLPNLDGIMTKQYSAGIEALVSYGPHLFVAFTSTVSSFQVLSRSTLNGLDAREGSGSIPNRTIAVFPGDPLVVLEVGPISIRRYIINPSNGKVTQEENFNVNVSQTSTQSATANGNTLFITGFLGTIIDRDANIVGHLSTGVGSFIQITTLTADEKTAIALVSDNVSFMLDYYDLTDLNNIQLKKRIGLPQGTYSDIILENNIVHVFGTSFNSGQAETFILRYPMF